MNIINFLENCVKKYPTKIAIIDDDRRLTYQEIYAEMQKFSSSIQFLNKKNVLSLISENTISFIIAYLGIINTGKIVHLVSPEISEKNLLNQLNLSNSEAIVCSKIISKKFLMYSTINIPIIYFEDLQHQKEIIIHSKSNELAYLIYTSGTTSEPKGVAISHEMTEFTTKNIVDVLEYSNSDVNVLPLPLNHSFGLGCFHTSLFVGSTLILLKNASDLEAILESLKKYNATTLAVVPATLTKLLKFDTNTLEEYFSSVRLVITNSTSIPKHTVQDFTNILKNGNLATYYGLTEASRSTFMIFDKRDGKEESVGKPAPGVQIKINSQQKESSGIGEIMIKGCNVIKKYWNNNKADKNIEDGWLKTGDIGFFDEENYLFLKGRIDDIINIGGEKVIPEEIENVVRKLSGIEDVVAFGIQDKVFGQIIKLNVVRSKDSDVDKLKILNQCIRNLERFKIPSKIEFVEKIPKTEYGKVKRFILK